MVSPAIRVDILERGQIPPFPLSVRQANSLLHELGRQWITDREVIIPLLHELRDWLDYYNALIED